MKKEQIPRIVEDHPLVVSRFMLILLAVYNITFVLCPAKINAILAALLIVFVALAFLHRAKRILSGIPGDCCDLLSASLVEMPLDFIGIVALPCFVLLQFSELGATRWWFVLPIILLLFTFWTLSLRVHRRKGLSLNQTLKAQFRRRRAPFVAPNLAIDELEIERPEAPTHSLDQSSWGDQQQERYERWLIEELHRFNDEFEQKASTEKTTEEDDNHSD